MTFFIFLYFFIGFLDHYSSKVPESLIPSKKFFLKKKKNFASEKKTPPLNYKLSPFFPLTIYYNDFISKRNSHKIQPKTSYRNYINDFYNIY